MSGRSQLHWDVPPAAELMLDALLLKLNSKSFFIVNVIFRW